MNLRFDILWCEDNESWFEQKQTELLTYIEAAAHLPVNIVRIDSYDDLSGINANDFDLFLIDYHLGRNENGGDVMEHLRKNSIHATIVFYSSEHEDTLREIVRTKRLDGVYVTSRLDANSFKDKVLIATTITVKKMLDVNSIRGAFLSEVAFIENKMDELICRTCLNASGVSSRISGENILRKYKNRILDQLNRQSDELSNSIDSIAALTTSHSFDLYKKSCLIQNILKELLNLSDSQVLANTIRETVGEAKSYSTRFQKEVIDVRNPLAHQSEEDVTTLYMRIIGEEGREKNLFSVLDTIQARLDRHLSLLNDALALCNKNEAS